MDSSIVPVMTWYYAALRDAFRLRLPEGLDVIPLLLGALQFAVALLIAMTLRSLWVRISGFLALRSSAKPAGRRKSGHVHVAQFTASENEPPLDGRRAA